MLQLFMAMAAVMISAVLEMGWRLLLDSPDILDVALM